jgi:hypothetical protein
MSINVRPGSGRKWITASAVLIAAVILFLLIGSFYATSKGQEQAPYLSFSADIDGVKAVRTLLARKGIDAGEWRHPWVRLPKGSGHTLIAVEPYGIDPKEKTAVEVWLEQGNHVLWISRNVSEGGIRPLVTESVARSPRDGGVQPVHVKRNAAIGDIGTPASFEAAAVQASERLKPSEQAELLLSDERGILAARYPVGQGSLTVLLAPEWLLNGTILQKQHFELVWPLLMDSMANPDNGLVWFDEYHHGYHAKPGILAVYPDWMLAVYIQAGLAALLALWHLGKRFGPIETPREWTVRRGDETVLAVAGWHRRMKLRRASIGQQEQYLRQLIQERWGVRVSAGDQELVLAARVHGGETVALKLAALLRRLQEIREPGRYPDSVFLQDCSRIAEITDLLEKEWD